MLIIKKKNLFALLILFVLAFPFVANAGFGISPPYVKTSNLLPGSKYEQTITLLRSSSEDVLEADVSIEAPDIKSWISIDKGNKFDLPKDLLQVPMVITVAPPASAELGNYKGYINVRVSPKGAAASGGVAIALGARIDVDITLSNEEAPDFKVRVVSIQNLEVPESPWNWPILRWFFYRTKVTMTLENTGNVKTAPSKVTLETYDSVEKNLLETGADKSLEKIDPYAVKEISASFPTRLGPGDYWGKVKIYKNNEVLNSYKIAYRIASAGTYPAGRIKLGYWPIVIYGGVILIIILLIFILYKIKVWRVIWRLLYSILSVTILAIWRPVSRVFTALNKKFWKWVKSKASKYDD